MTFIELQNDTLDKLNYNPGLTIPDQVRSRVQRELNTAHKRLLTLPGMSRLRDRVSTFASVADQSLYPLNQNIARINRIYETTNNIRLTDRTLDWLRMDPVGSLTDTGTPVVYVPLGYRATILDPATTGLWAASSSASDITQTVSAQTIRTGGYSTPIQPTTLTGTTRVQLGTLTSHVDVVRFWINQVCQGDVTLYDAAAAGNVLAVIPAGATSSRYFAIYLYPTPASAVTYTVEHQIAIPEMYQEYDEPLIPVEFHFLLVSSVRYEELLIKQEYASADRVLLKELQPGIINLRSYIQNLDDTVVVPGGDDPSRMGNNLGSMYPRGRW